MRRTNGFTLVEILIALFIFTIVMAMVVAGLGSVVRAEEQISEKTVRLSTIQMAVTILTQDLQQIVPRSIRNEDEYLLPALAINLDDETLMTFTRGGWINPNMMYQRSSMQRVSYRWVDNMLVRRTWRVLDRVPESEYQERVLLTGVQAISVVYLDKDGVSSTSLDELKKNPVAIQISIQLHPEGLVKRVYRLPEGIINVQPKSS